MQLLLQHVQRSLSRLLLCHSNRLNRLRKGPLVHLLVLVERDGFDLHRNGRHHVGWLLVEDEVVESLDVHLLIAHDIGCDELTATTAFHIESLHSDILDAWEFADDSLHLFQFDAEATDLYLSILTSHKLDVAVRQIAHNIAGTIAAGKFVPIPFILFNNEGILNKHLCCFIGTVQIASTYLRPTGPKLAYGTSRQTMSLRIDNI